MATFEGPLGGSFRGRIDGLSFYKRKDSDKNIVRKNGQGHTKEKLKNDPNLELVRRGTSEFGGQSIMSKFLMRALTYQKPMADYNIAGPLTALMGHVLQQDTVGTFGQRSISLSRHTHYLKGFSLNTKYPLDSVLRYPVTGSVDRETLSATVHIPACMPGINFHPPVSHPHYAFRISLAIVPDIVYNGESYGPIHHSYPQACAEYLQTDWFTLLEGSVAMDLEITHPQIPSDTNFTMVLSVGILYGKLIGSQVIQQVKHAGCAKVIEVG
jgi:hypothetical protein